MILKFHKLTEKHLDMVRNWRNDPEISKYMNTDDYITEEAHLNWFNKVKKDPTTKFWVVEADGKNVGSVYLIDIDMINRRCYWGYYLEVSARGKGIGRLIELNILKYVFEKLNLNKLCGEVLSSNYIVVEIHKKYGSKVEGILRKQIFKQNKFIDIVSIGILKEEWEEIKKQFNFQEVEIN